MAFLNLELLKLLQTNVIQSADLSLIKMAKQAGILYNSKKLKSNMKLISESVTGYYRKVLFEVPE